MSAMAVNLGGEAAPLPKRNNGTNLKKGQKLTLAEQYLDGDDRAKQALINKWGRGRVRRSLLEFARHEHDREYRALRERDEI